MSNKNKKGGMVYSTNPDYDDNKFEEDEASLAPHEQYLKVSLDRKQRKGKVVTLVEGYQGYEDEAKELAKTLKQHCGTGGSCKDGQIIVQGDVKDKVLKKLKELGFNVS